MSPDDKSKWFIIAGEAILKDKKMEGNTLFHIIFIPRDESFRVMIERGKEKVAFSVPKRMRLTQFEDLFSQQTDELRKKVTGSGQGKLFL